MERRQLILLIILGIVLAVAAYLYLVEPMLSSTEVEEPDEGRASVEGALAQVTARLSQSELSEAEIHKLAMIAEGTVAPPFYASDSPFYFAGFDAGAEVGYAYTGYLEAGSYRLAIINGIEYSVGEELADGSFELAEINPEFVLLERRNEDDGRMTRVRIPLMEEDAETIQLRTVR